MYPECASPCLDYESLLYDPMEPLDEVMAPNTSIECTDTSFDCSIAGDYYEYVCATMVPFIDFTYDLEGETRGKLCVPKSWCQTVYTTGYSEDYSEMYDNFLDCSREICAFENLVYGNASQTGIDACRGCVEIGGGLGCRGHLFPTELNPGLDDV